MRTFIKRVDSKATVHYGQLTEPVWIYADSFSSAVSTVVTNLADCPGQGLTTARLKILNTLLQNLMISETRRHWLDDCNSLLIYHYKNSGDHTDILKRGPTKLGQRVNLVQVQGSGLHFRSLLLNLADFVGWQVLDINQVTRSDHSTLSTLKSSWLNWWKSSRPKSVKPAKLPYQAQVDLANKDGDLLSPQYWLTKSAASDDLVGSDRPNQSNQRLSSRDLSNSQQHWHSLESIEE